MMSPGAGYRELETDLISYYRAARFEVAHVAARDYLTPPLSPDQLTAVWNAYRTLPKPVLVHCSAGIDRTGKAVEYLQLRLANVLPFWISRAKRGSGLECDCS